MSALDNMTFPNVQIQLKQSAPAVTLTGDQGNLMEICHENGNPLM